MVVDRQGEVRGMFDATSRSQSQRLRTLLLKCLAEQGPEGRGPNNEDSANGAVEEAGAQSTEAVLATPELKPIARQAEPESVESP